MYGVKAILGDVWMLPWFFEYQKHAWIGPLLNPFKVLGQMTDLFRNTDKDFGSGIRNRKIGSSPMARVLR